jgi:hypothetical protein
MADMVALAVKVWALKISSQLRGFLAFEFIPCIYPVFHRYGSRSTAYTRVAHLKR